MPVSWGHGISGCSAQRAWQRMNPIKESGRSKGKTTKVSNIVCFFGGCIQESILEAGGPGKKAAPASAEQQPEHPDRAFLTALCSPARTGRQAQDQGRRMRRRKEKPGSDDPGSTLLAAGGGYQVTRPIRSSSGFCRSSNDRIRWSLNHCRPPGSCGRSFVN